VAVGRGRLGRLGAIAATLTIGLLLALAATARGEALPVLVNASVEGGGDWRSANDFDGIWSHGPGGTGVGAHLRPSGPAYASGAQFTPGLGVNRLVDVHVPGAGMWSLSVWLRDANGFETPWLAASITLRLDNVAPAVAFMPGETANQPSELVAAVSDPLSGV